MSESSNNGHTDERNGDGVGGKVYERLRAVGRGENRYENAHTNGEGVAIRKAAETKEPPHAVKRHPEDPPGAYQGAAEEVADPEQIRRNADRFGKASQALDPEWFEWLTRPLYRSVHDVRIGAIAGPARRNAGEQLKRSETTEAAIAEIQQEGSADEEKAERLQAAVIPGTERELMEAETEVKVAEGGVEAGREDVSRVRAEEEERRARREDTPRRPPLKAWLHESTRNLFARTRFSPAKAWLVFFVEVLGSAYLLAPNVADVIGTSFEVGLLISAVISIAMLAAAFAAGMGLAAVRLPGWAVGLSIVAAFGAVLVKFVPALDALRLADESGVGTLTAATLAAFLIAMVSGYAMATADDQRQALEVEEEETALWKKAGTPLGEALEVLDKAKQKLEAAEQNRDRLKKLLSALRDQVEKLRDKSSRAGAVAERRRQEGIEAEVEAETIRTVAEAAIEQEEAAAEWAYLIALAAQEKARAEELPKVPETPAAEPEVMRIGPGGSGELSLLQKLALGIAAAGGVASLFLGLLPLAVAVPTAAGLVLLDRGMGSTPRGGSRGGSVPPPDHRRRIVSAADGDNPLYIHQPDHMVPKYGDGGAGVGQRQ